MKISGFKLAWSLLIVFMLLGFSQGGFAQEICSITLEEALGLVFEQNTSHSLFLREQELAEKRETLQKHPQITASTEPAKVADGQWQAPQGNLVVSMPLGDSLDLTSTVSIELDRSGVAVNPSGSLTLDYDFFALSEIAQGESSAEENLQLQTNRLVLQTLELLIQLRQQLDLLSYEKGRLEHLEASLEAAQLTPDYDDFELRRELRDQVANLGSMRQELEQLQLRLQTMLGTSETMVYEPVLSVGDLSLSILEEELRDELFSSSTNLRQAQGDLVLAQEELEVERKTRGWDLKASGGVHANTGSDPTGGSEPWSWDVRLSASKTLYPRNIVLEELELAVAQAEYALNAQEHALDGEFRTAVQQVRSAQNQVEIRAEHLVEAEDDWSFRQRQFEAGLVTELQIQDAHLALQKAKIDLSHSRFDHAQSILELWNLCGRDLQVFAFDVIH